MNANVQIGERILKARKQAGLTQNQLGQKVGRTAASIAYFEKGQRKIDPETLKQIAISTGKPLAYFYEQREQEVYEKMVTDLDSRLQEIRGIMEQIEAHPQLPTKSHHERFERMTENIRDLFQENIEEKWRQLVQNSPDYILTIDPEGRILTINRTHPNMDLNQVIGQTIYSMMHPSSVDESKAIVDNAVLTREPGVYRAKGFDEEGKWVWWEGQLYPLVTADGVQELLLVSRMLNELNEDGTMKGRISVDDI